MAPHIASRKILAALPWIIGPVLIGGILGHEFGMVCGLIVGVAYIVGAAFGGDNIPKDAFGARLMEGGEILDISKMVDKYAERAGIGPPSLYVVAIDEPNVLVWASGDGRTGFARIGVPPQISHVLTYTEIDAVMALAVARIASGEASVLTFGAALSGLILHPFLSRAINARLGIFRPDPDTRLTPIGAFFVALCLPASRLTLSAVLRPGALEFSDAYAARMINDPNLIATVLYKMAQAGPEPGTGALRAYNPGLLPMFVASPFDKLHGVAHKSPLAARLVSVIADAGPTTTLRAQTLQNMQRPDTTKMPVKVQDKSFNRVDPD